jgi:protein ImuB
MPLADARALAPKIIVSKHQPKDDAEALTRLAGWGQRFSPITGVDGADGLWLDITGCAHLFGGEDKMLTLLRRQLHEMGYPSRAAIADTRSAAWAVARYGQASQAIVPFGLNEDFLSSLPVEALGIDAEIASGLSRVGLRRIADLKAIPRASLARRFSGNLLERLDTAFGLRDEARSPHKTKSRIRAWEKFAEPISATSDVEACIRILLEKPCASLILRSEGARMLWLHFHRVDGSMQELEVGTSAPVRDPGHLYRLFALKIETIEPGFGIELAVLEAIASESIRPMQAEALGDATTTTTLPGILDRLANRFGPRSVLRLAAHASHIPERAIRFQSVFAASAKMDWPQSTTRPCSLLPHPQIVSATERDDGAPVAFSWRRVEHRIVNVQGPERIEAEWWHQAGEPRDYYRVEDARGRRLWLYRQETARGARWFVHGLFA